jgi:hypothetical protein
MYQQKYDSGFRDQSISQWHKKLGGKAPACDLDAIITSKGIIDDSADGFKVIEFNWSVPYALIDYKNENWKENLNSFNISVQANLATMAGLPSFVVVYTNTFTKFKIIPTNPIGFEKLNQRNSVKLTEHDYCVWLHWLRGVEADQEILATLYKGKYGNLN